MSLPFRAFRFLLLVPLLAAVAGAREAVTISSGFPGGNIVVGKIEGDTVLLQTDLRDTKGDWFYWYFQVEGASGRTLNFQFTRGTPVGVRGPAVSLDEGKNWRWLGMGQADAKSFSHTFSGTPGKVRFSFAMPYTRENLEGFLAKAGPHPALVREVLCKSRKGRDVERLRLGKIEGEPRFRVLVTARSHACEMMASYAAEGLMGAVLADDARGGWFRENVEMMVIPFVDKDGVEDGDQGKNRAPHDHNRDYDPGGLYPETQAILRSVPAWADGKLKIGLDLHCPHIRGATNEKIYLVGHQLPAMAGRQTEFSKLLENGRKGPLPYAEAGNIPFGKDWNTAANFTAGTNGSRWMASIPGIDVAGTFELPYANAGGAEVNAESARAFGSDLATAIMERLKSAGAP
jgi:hypothetical protein